MHRLEVGGQRPRRLFGWSAGPQGLPLRETLAEVQRPARLREARPSCREHAERIRTGCREARHKLRCSYALSGGRTERQRCPLRHNSQQADLARLPGRTLRPFVRGRRWRNGTRLAGKPRRITCQAVPWCVRNTQDRDAACKRCGCRREPRIATTQSDRRQSQRRCAAANEHLYVGVCLVPELQRCRLPAHAGYVLIGRRCRHRRASFGSWAAASEQPEPILGFHVCPAKRQAGSSFARGRARFSPLVPVLG